MVTDDDDFDPPSIDDVPIEEADEQADRAADRYENELDRRFQ